MRFGRAAPSISLTAPAGCRTLASRGSLGDLYADMMQDAAIRNIEETFAGISTAASLKSGCGGYLELHATIFTLGVGVNNSNRT